MFSLQICSFVRVSSHRPTTPCAFLKCLFYCIICNITWKIVQLSRKGDSYSDSYYQWRLTFNSSPQRPKPKLSWLSLLCSQSVEKMLVPATRLPHPWSWANVLQQNHCMHVVYFVKWYISDSIQNLMVGKISFYKWNI